MVASAKALAMTFELLPDGRSGRIDFLVCAVGNESNDISLLPRPVRALRLTTPQQGSARTILKVTDPERLLFCFVVGNMASHGSGWI
jgi:hypothetical protein